DEELRRVRAGVLAARRLAPRIPVSVDTFRASVARRAVEEWGAHMVNDISGGALAPDMFRTVAALRVPYVLMHMRGTPSTMQTLTKYPEQGVAATVAAELSPKLRRLALMGVADVIVDPGFGFAKTVEQNYELMDSLGDLGLLVERPLLVGISRKSMMTRLFGITASEALPATSALNMAALLQGASIIRVHDVAEAVQVREMAGRLSREPLTCITETPRK
ncbi:MAG: dihydropteroate synthase, partial [Paramuribaculum sp.]|nr:dihydropteroate synthase [Paramuribaculum sp.]